MLVLYLFAMALRKYPDCENSIVVATIPLNSIMSQQLTNKICPVAILSMKGKMTGSGQFQVDGEAELSCTGEEILSGHYPILFAHPESLVSEPGQQLMRKLKIKKMFRGLFLDEWHQVKLLILNK